MPPSIAQYPRASLRGAPVLPHGLLKVQHTRSAQSTVAVRGLRGLAAVASAVWSLGECHPSLGVHNIICRTTAHIPDNFSSTPAIYVPALLVQ